MVSPVLVILTYSIDPSINQSFERQFLFRILEDDSEGSLNLFQCFFMEAQILHFAFSFRD